MDYNSHRSCLPVAEPVWSELSPNHAEDVRLGKPVVLSTKSEKKYFPPQVVIFFLLLLTIALKRRQIVSPEKGAPPIAAP